MLWLNDACIDPGDIIFLVSNKKRSWSTALKTFMQSVPTKQRKHGHMEVVSVFVCTGENQFGKIFYNHERHIKKSYHQTHADFQALPLEELKIRLSNLLGQDENKDLILKILSMYGNAGSELAEKIKVESLSFNEISKLIIDTIETEALQVSLAPPAKKGIFRRFWQSITKYFIKESLVEVDLKQLTLANFIFNYWVSTDRAVVLSGSSHSLLVFKHTRPGQRQTFLEYYQQQIHITEEYQQQHRKRTDFWGLFKASFQSAKQHEQDKDRHEPAHDTYCARNIIEVLNQMDPTLVDRGCHVLPKALEAGMRAATKPKQEEFTIKNEIASNQDDGEIDWDAIEKAQPPFRMVILPAAGKDLLRQLMDVVFAETARLYHKKNKDSLDRLESIIAPYRCAQYSGYTKDIRLQVDSALHLLATLLPLFASIDGVRDPFTARSYKTIRAFARTQGIFDGDVRNAAKATLENQDELEQAESERNSSLENSIPSVVTKGSYILSDWSFHSWSEEKRTILIPYFMQLIKEGCPFYIWQKNRLLAVDCKALDNLLHTPLYFEMIENITPNINQTIIDQAKRQLVNDTTITLLDYANCATFSGNTSNLEEDIETASRHFATQLSSKHIHDKFCELIDIELTNAADRTDYSAQLQILKKKALLRMPEPSTQTTYQSGIDTYTPRSIRAKIRPTPLFSTIKKGVSAPIVNYERKEVYNTLSLLENPTSSYQLFELQGNTIEVDSMEPSSTQLIPCEFQYHFHPFESNFLQQLAKEENVYFRTTQKLSLDSHWQALPSCCAEEQLAHITIQAATFLEFEIKKSPNNNRHYIRRISEAETSQTLSIDFLLKMPAHYQSKPASINLLRKSNPDIYQLLRHYSNYSAYNSRLNEAAAFTNGEDYLEEARRLRAGSCRLRVIAFKDEMQRKFPQTPVNIVVNDLHCYVEIKLDNKWQSYCLGGGNPSLCQQVSRSLEGTFFSRRPHTVHLSSVARPLEVESQPLLQHL